MGCMGSPSPPQGVVQKEMIKKKKWKVNERVSMKLLSQICVLSIQKGITE